VVPLDSALDTQRMQLRRTVASDGQDFLELDSDPEVMRFINGGRPSSPTDVERWLAQATACAWTARVAEDGRFIGWFSLRTTAPDEQELGYRLRRAEWGKGLATEGSVALVARAFDDPSVRRIWAQTMTVNQASRRVMERVGLEFVRTFFGEWDDEIPGGEHGDVEYELTRAGWLNRGGSSTL